jgi:hypothetical protein
MAWDNDVERRIRDYYGYGAKQAPGAAPLPHDSATAINDDSFVTEIAGRIFLTAPATHLTDAGTLPAEMAALWEKASAANPNFLWMQGPFVEAEKANRNGALWTTEDLQFGEMSVKNGPINWLHNERKIVGTIADNRLVLPTTEAAAAATARPYIAAVGAIWSYVYPEEAHAIEMSADMKSLYWSMECIAEQIACETSDNRQGCGKSFGWMEAQNLQACSHINERSSARRMVNPSFLGGAVIVPPVKPGWRGTHRSNASSRRTSRASRRRLEKYVYD